MSFRNSIVAGIELIREAIQSRNFVTGVSGWRIARDGTAEFLNVIIRGLITATDIQAGPLPNFTVQGSTGIVTMQGAIKKIQIVPTGNLVGTPDIRFWSEDNTQIAYINQPAADPAHASIGMNSGPFVPADAVTRRGRVFLSSESGIMRLEVIDNATQNIRGGALLADFDGISIAHVNMLNNMRFLQVNDDGIFFWNAHCFTDPAFEFQVRGILRILGSEGASVIVESGATFETDSGSTTNFDGDVFVRGDRIAGSKNGINGQAVTSGTNDTTAAAFADMGGTGAVTSFAFTKRQAATRLKVTMHASFYSITSVSDAMLGVRINGTDYDMVKGPGVLNERQMWSATRYISGIAAHSGTVQARWYRAAGTGTVRRDTADWLSLSVEECT
jgi:hypothetical protein